MLMCPMCQKALTEWTRECPRCRADLSILVSYADHLQQGLARADALTRQGELGEAVWAYLEVLEVDPDNDAARRQVAGVATAVRQFDRVAVSRRWLERLRRQARFRRWLTTWQAAGSNKRVHRTLLVAVLLLAALILGYEIGRHVAHSEPSGNISVDSVSE